MQFAGKRIKFLLLFLIIISVIAAIFFFWRSYEEGNRDAIILYGNVDIRQVDLGFRVFGKVTQLMVEEGDSVEPGQLLATMDSTPYLDAKEEVQGRLEKNAAEFANADQQFQRREGLVPVGSVSDEDYQQNKYNRMSLLGAVKETEGAMRRATLNISDTELVCPERGTVLSRVREPGSVVQPGEPIFVVSIASPVWVRAYVSEPELGEIYPGMLATIHTDTPSHPTYKGHIGFISPVAEFTPKNVETTKLRTDLVYRLRVVVDNPDQGLRQGMPVTVKLLKLE